jgi:transcriptional regulator with XRE-family HTH domain
MVSTQEAAVDYLGGNGAAELRWYRFATRPGSNMQTATPQVGTRLREWRQRRRLTQLDLALDAEISPRHLSFVETGRSQPSREMLLHLSEQLEIPLRERNALLVSAGFAPIFAERALDDSALAAARAAIDVVLEAQKPFPAFALDRHWNVAASNSALQELYEGVAPELKHHPVNALRLTLHPRGMAPRIANLAEWRAHLVSRLRRQLEITGDKILAALLEEVSGYNNGPDNFQPPGNLDHAVLVPLKIHTSLGLLSFFSTTTVFGTPTEVTLSELAIELFFPADADTARAVRKRS